MTEICIHSREINECTNMAEFRAYEDKIYKIFLNLYTGNTIKFQDKSVSMKRYPPEFTERSGFYHLVCENYFHTGDENDRNPNLRRYERITWAKQLIVDCSTIHCGKFLVWENNRKGKKSILIYCEEIDYLVVLGMRNDYYIIITAYPIEQSHTRDKLLKEYNAYNANNALN